MADETVTLVHPDFPGKEWTIPASMLPVHEDTGWVPKERQTWDDPSAPFYVGGIAAESEPVKPAKSARAAVKES